MDLAVGIAVLVTVALLENVSGHTAVAFLENVPGQYDRNVSGQNLTVRPLENVSGQFGQNIYGQNVYGQNKNCEIAGGTCHSLHEADKCKGVFRVESFFCNDQQGCCIPPGCLFGSNALPNNAVVQQGICRRLQCKEGNMVVDDTKCQDFNPIFVAKCKRANGQLLNEALGETLNEKNKKCFIIKSDLKDWDDANQACRTIHDEAQLASFEGVEDVGNLLIGSNAGIFFWIGGSDTAQQTSWTWLNGKPISSDRIERDCLSVATYTNRGKLLKFKDEACYNKKGYICEIVEAPETCDCNYNKYGCTLAKPTAPGYACQCEVKEETRCDGTVVRCNDPDSVACKTSGTSFEHCMQGVRKRERGNCCGYYSAHKNYCY